MASGFSTMLLFMVKTDFIRAAAADDRWIKLLAFPICLIGRGIDPRQIK